MKKTKEDNESLAEIPSRDLERARSNNAAELWELIEKYSITNSSFALKNARRILEDPTVFIKTRDEEHRLAPWNLYLYARRMMKSDDAGIAMLGSEWLESRMLDRPPNAFRDIELPEASKKKVWSIWNSVEEQMRTEALKDLLASKKDWLKETERFLARRAFDHDQRKAIISQLKNMDYEHRGQTIDFITDLWKWSGDAREEISEICKENKGNAPKEHSGNAVFKSIKSLPAADNSEIIGEETGNAFRSIRFLPSMEISEGTAAFKSIKLLHDRTKSLIDAGVLPENAFSFVRLHADRFDDAAKGIKTMKKMHIDKDIIDFYVTKHSKADLTAFTKRMENLKSIGVNPRVAATATLLDGGPEKIREIMNYTGMVWDGLSTVNCIRKSKAKNMEFWLDNIFELGKLRTELSYTAMESVARVVTSEEKLATFSQTFYSFCNEKNYGKFDFDPRPLFEGKTGDRLAEIFSDKTLPLNERLKRARSYVKRVAES
ncbi:hypothetical protein H0N99_03945 [Candidatus Micrarchaeota archaeon]|nr:hypothetical protein [Candidatus Micrarchaeota archaeon]